MLNEEYRNRVLKCLDELIQCHHHYQQKNDLNHSISAFINALLEENKAKLINHTFFRGEQADAMYHQHQAVTSSRQPNLQDMSSESVILLLEIELDLATITYALQHQGLAHQLDVPTCSVASFAPAMQRMNQWSPSDKPQQGKMRRWLRRLMGRTVDARVKPYLPDRQDIIKQVKALVTTMLQCPVEQLAQQMKQTQQRISWYQETLPLRDASLKQFLQTTASMLHNYGQIARGDNKTPGILFDIDHAPKSIQAALQDIWQEVAEQVPAYSMGYQPEPNVHSSSSGQSATQSVVAKSLRRDTR